MRGQRDGEQNPARGCARWRVPGAPRSQRDLVGRARVTTRAQRTCARDHGGQKRAAVLVAPHAPAAEAVTLVQLLTQGGSGEAAHNMAPYLPGHAVTRCARINIQWFFPQGCSSRELRAVLQHPRDGGAALRANAARRPPAAAPAAAGGADLSPAHSPQDGDRQAILPRARRPRVVEDGHGLFSVAQSQE